MLPAYLGRAKALFAKGLFKEAEIVLGNAAALDGAVHGDARKRRTHPRKVANAGQNAAIQSLAAKVLQLDIALADYGPDALSERVSIRESLRDTIEETWNSREAIPIS